MSKLLEATETFVTHLLSEELDSRYLYHNLRHTQRVVQNTKELLEHYGLDEKERSALLLAAWLHDTGYTGGSTEHEKESARIAEKFLSEQGVEAGTIKDICALIMATQRYHDPESPLEEIIRDADASHLGRKDFVEISELLREELAQLDLSHYTPGEWREANIEMFRTEHRYYTEYAREHWQPGKDKNLQRLIKEKKAEKKLAKKEQLKARFKEENPERGIQTMYRVTMRNHLKLSDIADTKANILLSVNAIILSLVIANLIPKLDNPSNDYLIIPTLIFCVFSILSMILSVMATRPNVTGGFFTQEDVKERKVNLLFFGNFHQMKLDDFQWAMRELIKDKEYVYDSLTKDLYYLGRVLNRKYRLLRWTYTIFLLGMIFSVISFFLALKYYGPERFLDLAA
jgi:predicted metal-dependent HD superfamily phosphohydrolase